MITIEDSALLIVDVQGKLAEQMHHSTSLLENLSILIQGATLLSVPVIWVEQLPNKLGKTHSYITPYLSGRALEKSTFSSWGSLEVRSEIERINRKNLIVAGIESHVCVYQTVRDLLKEDYSVHVVRDAVSSRVIENKNLGLEAMKSAGASMTSTEMVLFELQQVAEGDVFRQMIKLIK